MTRIAKFSLLCVLLALPVPLTAQFERTDIHDRADQAQPLLPGMKAPVFEVRDANGDPVRFDPDAMPKPLVLTFYRGGWCPYCHLHLSELRHAERVLRELGFDIWFISVDQPEVIRASLEEPETGYRVLSDSKLAATRAFGLAFRMTDELVARYLEFDIDVEAASGETHHVLPVPSTFIIGIDGVITFQYTNPDYRVRLHPDVLLAAARAYREDADKRLPRQREAMKAEQSAWIRLPAGTTRSRGW